MEKSPVKKVHSKYLKMTIREDLNEYLNILEKKANSPHKYETLMETIKLDCCGDPIAFIQYVEIVDEEERKKAKVTYFAEILDFPNDLDKLSSLTEDSLNKKVAIAYSNFFTHHEKDMQYDYMILIYYKVTNTTALEAKKLKQDFAKPVEERQ